MSLEFLIFIVLSSIVLLRFRPAPKAETVDELQNHRRILQDKLRDERAEKRAIASGMMPKIIHRKKKKSAGAYRWQ